MTLGLTLSWVKDIAQSSLTVVIVAFRVLLSIKSLSVQSSVEHAGTTTSSTCFVVTLNSFLSKTCTRPVWVDSLYSLRGTDNYRTIELTARNRVELTARSRVELTARKRVELNARCNSRVEFESPQWD